VTPTLRDPIRLIARGAKAAAPGGPATAPDTRGVVYAYHKALCDDRGPVNLLGVSFFWLLWGLKYDYDRTIKNLDACVGADVVRMLCCVGQPDDSWSDRIIDPNWSDFSDVLEHALELLQARGMRALVTIFGDATSAVPDEASRAAHVDRVCTVLNRYPAAVVNVGVSNEGIGFPDDGYAEILRHTERVRATTPFLVSSVCGLEDAPATVYAARTERKIEGDGGVWEHTEQPYDLRNTELVASDEEPIGPQSSVAEDDDPLRNTTHAVCAWLCRAPLYVYHCGAGIRGGGAADVERGRYANFYDQPSFGPTLAMLCAARDYLPGDVAQWSRISHSDPKHEGEYPFATGPLQPFDPSEWFLKTYANRSTDGRFVCWFSKVEKDVPLVACSAMAFHVFDLRGGVAYVELAPGETYPLTVRGAALLVGTL